MTYTVWLKIENDMGQPGDEDEGWAILSPGWDEREDAVDRAKSAISLLSMNGFMVQRLDGWHQPEEEARTDA